MLLESNTYFFSTKLAVLFQIIQLSSLIMQQYNEQNTNEIKTHH